MKETIRKIFMKHLQKRWYINDENRDICFLTAEEIDNAVVDAINEIEAIVKNGKL